MIKTKSIQADTTTIPTCIPLLSTFTNSINFIEKKYEETNFIPYPNMLYDTHINVTPEKPSCEINIAAALLTPTVPKHTSAYTSALIEVFLAYAHDYQNNDLTKPFDFLMPSMESKSKGELRLLKTQYTFLKNKMERLETENFKLKKIAYKTYSQIQEERLLEIYAVTINTDALLLLMELREHSRLHYEDLRNKITEPDLLYLRVAELISINYVKEKDGYFCLADEAYQFFSHRGL